MSIQPLPAPVGPRITAERRARSRGVSVRRLIMAGRRPRPTDPAPQQRAVSGPVSLAPSRVWLPNDFVTEPCVVSAVFGGIDNLNNGHVTRWDTVRFSEQNTPVPLPYFDARMRAKYFKVLTHRVLPSRPGYLWIDGSYGLASDALMDAAREAIAHDKLLVTQHPSRSTVYEELQLIIRKMRKGSRYLGARYNLALVEAELALYRSEGLPENTPIFAAGIFARPNNVRFNALFQEWWNMILERNVYDQAMLSYLIWKYNVPYTMINRGVAFGAWLRRYGHIRR